MDVSYHGKTQAPFLTAAVLTSTAVPSGAPGYTLWAQIEIKSGHGKRRRPFWRRHRIDCSGCWLDGDKANKSESSISYIFLLLRAPFLPGKKGASKPKRGITGQPSAETSFSTLTIPKISIVLNADFEGIKKATPLDTLSVPLKISRLVWLSGADNRIRTDDLILTKDVLCLLSYISNFHLITEHIIAF